MKNQEIYTHVSDLETRRVIEKGNTKGIIDIEENRKDNLRQIDSGFNEVLAKLATKTNTAYIINFEKLKNAKVEEKSKLLSKIMQNIKIAQKYNTPLGIKGIKKEEKQAFLITIGASTKQAKEAQVF